MSSWLSLHGLLADETSPPTFSSAAQPGEGDVLAEVVAGGELLAEDSDDVSARRSFLAKTSVFGTSDRSAKISVTMRSRTRARSCGSGRR
jgi:hypothetical protein